MSDRLPGQDERPAGRPAVVWVVSLVLLAGALIPRLANLGDLSFYADEDLSVLVASSMAEGGGSVLPSGMEYRRALPYTWLNSVSIGLFGEASEMAVRLPSAIMGALTVVAIFLLGRRWFGLPQGLTAALLLTVSEWHLVFSRQSRMYVPLLLAIVLAVWGLWTWARSGRMSAFVGAMVSTILAIMLHRLGLLLAAAPVIWLLFPGVLAVSVPVVLATSGAIALIGLGVATFYIEAPYAEFPMPPEVARLAPLEPVPEVASLGILGFALAAIGLLLGAFLMRRMRLQEDSEPGSRLRIVAAWVLMLAAGVAAGFGQVYGFAVAGALFLLATGLGVAETVRRGGIALSAMPGLLGLHLAIWTPQVGFIEALKVGSTVPYPHAHTLLLQAPAPTILFGAAAMILVLLPRRREWWAATAATMLVIAMLAAIGLARDAGPTRYLLTAYPLMILVAGAGLYEGLRFVFSRIPTMSERPSRADALAVGTAGILVLAGALSGHGIPDAVRLVGLQHGDRVNELVHVFPFRPDHRSVGRYVRERRGEGHIVVVEDPIVQGWYVGEVDYWFRRYGDMRRYLRIQDDGSFRDIYVGSRAMPDPRLLNRLAERTADPIWLITSGETRARPRHYFSDRQRAWTDSLREARDPVFVGEDGVSAVFCLNCPISGSSDHRVETGSVPPG